MTRGEVDGTIAGDVDSLAAGDDDVQRASIAIEDGTVTWWTARRQRTGRGCLAVQEKGEIGRGHHAIVDGCPGGAGSDLEGDTGGLVLCCC